VNIGFYGASGACWTHSDGDQSWCDQLATHLGADIVNSGVPQGSCERILYELKKTNQLDIAIIFHTQPKYVFIPHADRDVSLSSVKPRRAELLWTERAGNIIPTPQDFESEFFSYGGLREIFGDTKNFIRAMSFMREYFYDPDLLRNRYQATMLLIDSYLHNNGIPVWHSIVPKHTPDYIRPRWGHIDTELATWQWPLVTDKNPHSPNNLTPEQNVLIYQTIAEWCDTIRK